MPAATRSLLSLVLFVVLQGCTHQVQLVRYPVAQRATAAVERNRGEHPAGEPVADAVHVRVDNPFQGINLRNGRDTGTHRYVFYELPRPPEGASQPDVVAFYEEFFERMHEEHNTQTVMQFVDFAPALVAALEDHLRRYFHDVSVTIDGEDPDITVAGARVRDDGIKRVEFSLEIDGKTVTSRGEYRTRRHWAWAMPLALLTAPLGTIGLQLAVAAIGRRDFGRATGDAVDEVARLIAEHIARRCRHTPAERPRYCGSPAAPVAP